MKKWATPLVITLAAIAGTISYADAVRVICRDGALHTMQLASVELGTPGAFEAKSVSLGPSGRVWVELPDRASVSRSQTLPIPVRELTANTVEVVLDFADGRQALTRLEVHRSAGGGRAAIELIRARIEMLSYGVPAECRVLAGRETRDYARALLNNAGCLLPSEVHEALNFVPGSSQGIERDCGWTPDTRAGMRALEKAADRGSVDAGWMLAQFYLGNVVTGIEDLERAYVRMSRTGGLGDSSADLVSGFMKWRGIGTEPDPQAAFAVLLPYARTGSKEAQGIIGTMYLTGAGVSRNNVHAYAWCSLAASGGARIHSDPAACLQAAETAMYNGQLHKALELATQIHNRQY